MRIRITFIISCRLVAYEETSEGRLADDEWLNTLVCANHLPCQRNPLKYGGGLKTMTERSNAAGLLHCGAVVRYKRGMPKTTPRKSPLVRATRRYPLAMIEDGSLILELLVSLRLATGAQVQRVIFNPTSPSQRQARHRSTRALRRLFDSGFIRRVSVFAPSSTGRMSMQVVNVLSAAGARTVGVDPDWIRRRAPKDGDILTHDFWLGELAVCAMEGCPEPLAITTWWDDRVLAGRKRQGLLSLPTIPDGLLVVQHLKTGKVFPSLVELDLGTETVVGVRGTRRDVSRKIEGYLEYIGSSFRQEFAIDASPVVLIVTESERRLASLRDRTQQLGGGGRFWFSTLERLGRKDIGNADQTPASAGLQGPFWASNWQTAHEDGWRSLAARCGA